MGTVQQHTDKGFRPSGCIDSQVQPADYSELPDFRLTQAGISTLARLG